MQVTISSRRADISDGLDEYTREKISRLDRYVDGLDYAEVHFHEEQNPRIADKEVCEVTLEGHGPPHSLQGRGARRFHGGRPGGHKLERQLRKLKTKLVNRWHQAGEPVPEGFDVTPQDASEDSTVLSR